MIWGLVTKLGLCTWQSYKDINREGGDVGDKLKFVRN